jgi:endonuclease/exonuclease/phosphatase family metal-dependent hydrolase
MAFRVMSFNIRGSNHPQDGANDWPGRAALNLATLRKHAPDLIGFQELEDGNLKAYEAELSDYRSVLGNRASESEHPAIFWKPAALDLRESGSFWLSETPNVYSGAWDTDCVRACTWARFTENASGTEFLHFNTHLDHISGWARTEGLRLILRRINDLRGSTLPVILTGDFNCDAYDPRDPAGEGRGDPNYRFLLEQGFVDTWLAAGNRDSDHANTFHNFRGSAFYEQRNGAGRIDWILALAGARRWQVLASGIIRDHDGDVYPSDHYPIFADMELT